MTISRSFAAIVAVAVLGAFGAWQASAAVGGGSAQVTFVNPERFSDFRGSGHLGKLEIEPMMTDLQRFIQREAERSIPAGRSLEVRIVDINDAGTLGSARNETRVARDISPATVDIEYALKEGGTEIASGKEHLTSITGSPTRTTGPETSMPAVKDALRRWVQAMGEK